MINLQLKEWKRNGREEDKRQQIELGDMIEFSKSANEKVTTKVIGLLRYRTFEDLLADFEIEVLADRSMTKEELLDALTDFYPLEKQKECGVVGIRIELSC